MNPLSERIYRYLQSRNGDIPPTVREIAAACRIKSTSTVHRHLNQLAAEGYIEKDSGSNRTVRLPAGGQAQVPIVGRVAAGVPITAIESIEGYVTFSGLRGGGEDMFALRVRGESMINAGILDGDVVIVRKMPDVRDGEIAVAMIGDEATIKTVYHEKNRLRLVPENDHMEPFYASEDVAILGKVIASLRYYEE